MLRLDCNRQQGFINKNSAIKRSNQSFGVNKITTSSSQRNVSALASHVVDVFEATRQTSNIQNASQSQAASETQIEEHVNEILASSVSETPSTDIENRGENSIENYDFFEKDVQAYKVLNSATNQSARLLSCFPVTGLIGDAVNVATTRRNQALDQIYEVPQYIPIEDNNKSFTMYWLTTSVLRYFTNPIGIGIPLVAGGLVLQNKAQKNLIESYHKAYIQEQKTAANETPEQTRERHKMLKEKYDANLIHKAFPAIF